MASDRPDDEATPRLDGAVLRPAGLAQRRTHRFARQPDADTLAALAREMDLTDLRKLRFEGTLAPVGQRDWDLTGHLGATVVQPCVATLAPVTTRIEERVERRFRTDMPDMPEQTEIEMPEDDTLEPLPDVIDLDAIMAEALVLALPAWPRASGVPPVQAQVTEPGQTPITDEQTRPFAGLAALRGRMGDEIEAHTQDGTADHDDGADGTRNDPGTGPDRRD